MRINVISISCEWTKNDDTKEKKLHQTVTNEWKPPTIFKERNKQTNKRITSNSTSCLRILYFHQIKKTNSKEEARCATALP